MPEQEIIDRIKFFERSARNVFEAFDETDTPEYSLQKIKEYESCLKEEEKYIQRYCDEC